MRLPTQSRRSFLARAGLSSRECCSCTLDTGCYGYSIRTGVVWNYTVGDWLCSASIGNPADDSKKTQ